MEEIDLRLGDCLEVMQSIPNKSIDAIICDLPYGTTACKWDTVIPFEPLWEQYKRIIKNNGAIVLFGSQPFTSALINSNIKMFKYCWVWDKANSTNFLNAKKQPLRQTEDVVVFYDNLLTYNPQMEIRGKDRIKGGYNKPNGSDNYNNFNNIQSKNNLYYPTNLLKISNAHKKGKVHPTQKPIALMEYLVKTYTNQGDIVLDNCMGSGTTGVACKNLSRKFIGIEQDPNYFKIAKERINV